MTEQTATTVDRIPYCHKVRYGVTGAPDLPPGEGSYAPGITIAPTLIELVYSAAGPEKPARVAASVTGYWVCEGERERPQRQIMTHYADGPDGWPEWLAEEARLHDPEAAPLVVSRFDAAMEHAVEEPPGLTVGAIAEDGRPVALVLDEETRAKVAGWLAPEIEQLRARVAELEAERAKYVGKEPTIAEEMAYLSRCFHAVHAVCDEAEQQARRWENPLPVPDWVATVRAAATGERPEDPNDNRRRIYLDAKSNAWISVSHEDGTEWVVPVQPAAFVEQDVRDVADETGGLREIGRCW